MAGDDAGRRDLAKFLRSRRARMTPAEVGLPSGSRRRASGLRREEVALLAGVSPTWYAYLEQGRNIRASREVMESLARVLRLDDDERRYLHSLSRSVAPDPPPLSADIPGIELIRQVVALSEKSPYPVYAADQYCDLLAWNPAANHWYDDWGALPPAERNILRWMLLSPVALERLVDWEEDTRDAVARWRAVSGRYSGDPVLQARIEEFSLLSSDFRAWWAQHQVVEHRSRFRRFQHPQWGLTVLRIIPLFSQETSPSGVVVHVPVDADARSHVRGAE
jgi:transcriptional regulator with XRE-family HTH domain